MENEQGYISPIAQVGMFNLWLNNDGVRYDIKHGYSGISFSRGWQDLSAAVSACKEVYETAGKARLRKLEFLTGDKLIRTRDGQNIAKYLQRQCTCENNVELEKVVGRFWRDRKEADAILSRLAPKKKETPAKLAPVYIPADSPRSLYLIAADIKNHWQPIGHAALPYVDAMSKLTSINDNYGLDSGKDIVLRFLCNSSAWRGEAARGIKAELKAIAGVK